MKNEKGREKVYKNGNVKQIKSERQEERKPHNGVGE